MKKEELINYLAKCSGAELSEIINSALAQRDENGTQNGMVSRLVLCEASRLEDKNTEYYSGWDFSPIAVQDESEYERTFKGEPFSQSGQCLVCNVEVTSHAKIAICPLCGTKVSCT